MMLIYFNKYKSFTRLIQWSQLAELRSTLPIATTDFLYLRFIIGDRSIDEKNFEKIQKDRVMEMKKWASKVAHIHKGKAGENGPIIVTLFNSPSSPTGHKHFMLIYVIEYTTCSKIGQRRSFEILC